MNPRSLFVAMSACLVLLMSAPPAGAAKYDLNLGRYFSTGCDLDCAQQHFEDLMMELGQISAPIFLSPAETLGLNGFTFAIEGTIAPISGDQDFWINATEGVPGDVLFIPHIHVRKGLPFSFEIGTQLSYIPDSELFVVGAELKWALNEGFYFIPDLAVRMAFNHMIGAKDFEMTVGGWDISLSKAFGIAGMLALTPYAGYNMFFVHASSHVIIQQNTDATFTNHVFWEVDWNDHMFHRFFVGVRLSTFIFQIIVEGAFTLSKNRKYTPDRDFLSGVHPSRSVSGVSMFNFKLGFDY